MSYLALYLIVGVVVAAAITPELAKYQQRFGRPWVAIAVMFVLLALGWPLLLLGFGKQLIALRWVQFKLARNERRMAEASAVLNQFATTRACQRCGAVMPRAWAFERFRVRLSFPLRAVCYRCASLPWWRRL